MTDAGKTHLVLWKHRLLRRNLKNKTRASARGSEVDWPETAASLTFHGPSPVRTSRCSEAFNRKRVKRLKTPCVLFHARVPAALTYSFAGVSTMSVLCTQDLTHTCDTPESMSVSLLQAYYRFNNKMLNLVFNHLLKASAFVRRPLRSERSFLGTRE